jgi:hypothetical protein
VQIIPTNKPVARQDSNDVVFRNTKGKWNAVTTEIARMHKTGRPVLVGTTSVETSELVAKMLSEKGIKHEVRSLFSGLLCNVCQQLQKTALRRAPSYVILRAFCDRAQRLYQGIE